MKLIKARVKGYRSVIDSVFFDVEQTIKFYTNVKC